MLSGGPSTSPLGCTLATSLRLTVIALVLSMCLACHKQTVACYSTGVDAGCSVVPVRKRSDLIVHVYMDERRTCTVDGQLVACSDVGKKIRAAHPSDDPTVSFCAARALSYEAIGLVLGTISREVLPMQFGCSAGAVPGAT